MEYKYMHPTILCLTNGCYFAEHWYLYLSKLFWGLWCGSGCLGGGALFVIIDIDHHKVQKENMLQPQQVAFTFL